LKCKVICAINHRKQLLSFEKSRNFEKMSTEGNIEKYISHLSKFIKNSEKSLVYQLIWASITMSAIVCPT
jgi:hypothetical protein